MDIDARRESGVADLHAFDFVLNQETAPAAMHRGNIPELAKRLEGVTEPHATRHEGKSLR